ncbi:MAG: hypothetical protein WA581_07975 [Candidatus Acidiferrales bacterium]
MNGSEVGLSAVAEADWRRLVERMEKLERQNRLWKLGSVLAALVLVLSVALGTRAQQQRDEALRAKTVEAETFLLKDSDGVTRGELTVVNGIPVLQLYNANGKVFWSTVPRVVTEVR